MPTTIGNTKVYSAREVKRATLFSYSAIIRKLQKNEIKSRQTAQGAYEVEHGDLVDYLVREQDIPPSLVDEIIEFRISNANITPLSNQPVTNHE